LPWGKNDVLKHPVLDFERANSHSLEEVTFSYFFSKSFVFAFPGQRRTSGFDDLIPTSISTIFKQHPTRIRIFCRDF